MKNIAIVFVIVFVCCFKSNCIANDLSVINVSATLVNNQEIKKIDDDSYIEWKFNDFIISVNVMYTGIKSLKDIIIRISYITKVGNIVYADPDKDFVAMRDTEHTSYWFAPLLIKTVIINEIKPNHTENIKINTDLHEIILNYDKRDLWVTACKLVISLEPQGPEDDLKNNTKEFGVKIMTPQE